MNKRRKKYVLLYVSLLITFILQTTVAEKIAVFNVAPQMLLVFAICFSMANDVVPSMVFSGIAGLLTDISGSGVVGFNTLLMLYLSLGIVYIGSEFFRDTPRAAIMLTALCTFLYELVFFIFTFAIFGDAHFFYMVYRVILPEIVYNSIVSIPIYLYVQKFLRIKSGNSLLD